MRVTVIGSGYVGLVAGACLAETGNHVICADRDPAKIASLQQGTLPIYEPGLEQLVARNTAGGRLEFTTDLPAAIRHGDIVFIAVGTPPGEDGSADLQHVLDVARTIGQHLDRFKIIVTKSTVPVGTAEKVRSAAQATSSTEFAVASNPEFLKEGAAIEDFMKPDRVVLGVDDPRAEEALRELYAPFVRTGSPILFMDIPSAEVTKYAANAMLATRISFMNQIAELCERVGADVFAVRKGIGSDSRIGPAFLFPGPGYGGSCFPKDVKALVHTARGVGMPSDLFDAVEAVNHRQKQLVFTKLERLVGSLSRKTVAVWGLAFKAGTDDMRESPSITLVEALLAAGARVSAHDPEAMIVARGIWDDRVTLTNDPYAAVAGADALCVMTEWLMYRTPDFERIKQAMRQPTIVDGRNLYDPARVRRMGFAYAGIGRPTGRVMRVAITGAAGFVGSHLVDRFLAGGHDVVGLDNFLTGRPDNVAHLAGDARFQLITHDVSDPFEVEGRVDGVLHFASPASPPDYQKFPLETLNVGSRGTTNALDVARKHGARFFLASTSEVYGDPTVHPQPETYWGYVNSVGERSMYDEAKRFAEAMTMVYHRSFKVDTRIVRIFNTYGPRMRPEDGRVVSNFIVQALRGDPLTIYGDGRQTRSFCFVSDLVEGIYRLFQSSRVEPTNIGNPGEFTMLELANLVIELTGSTSPIVHRPLPADDPRQRKPDIAVARAVLQWQPDVALHDGLVRTIDYFREVTGRGH